MDLGAIAERWVNEPMEAFNETTLSFEPAGFEARISLVDRFLSNFNRPLRRRMLHYSPSATLPASSTIRHPDTGDVYLIGQRRDDSDQGTDYHALAVCHLVTDEGPGSSAGLAEVVRASPVGPADDPGWLVESTVAHHYTDLEFRSSLNEADLHQTRIESFVLWLPSHADLRKYDFLLLKGRRHRVTDVYPDSGFIMARVDQEDDFRIDTVVHVKEGKVYDQQLMRYVASNASYNVTMLLDAVHDYASWVSDSQDHVLLSVEEDHIGFRPQPGMEVEFEGRRRVIRYVHYYRGERQYKLRCR